MAEIVVDAEIIVDKVHHAGARAEGDQQHGLGRPSAGRTARAWLRRGRRSTVACDPGLQTLRRLEHAREVLERARTIVERGWWQHGWLETGSRPGSARSLLATRPPVVDEVRNACLVAAVAVSAHSGGARPDVLGDAGPVLDLVWDALEELGGQPGPDVAGRAAPPEVRVARMRDLTRWNDVPGRTRRDVLALLDRTISRTILSAMREPQRAGA